MKNIFCKLIADVGTILRAVFWWSLALATMVGVLVWVQAHFPAIIPVP